MKNYYTQQNVGQVRHTVNYHDGVKTHGDGSPFYDMVTCRTKKSLDKIIRDLQKGGYIERGILL
jgi:hypothetical protein